MRGAVVGLMVLGSVAVSAQDKLPIALAGDADTHIQEFVIGVSDMARAKPVYTDVLKWKVKHAGPADLSIVNLWRLDLKAKVDEVLVGNEQSAYGFVRLVEIAGAERVIARPNGSWFDTGGMLNLNVLVKNLDETVTGLRRHGFHGFAEPESYVYPTGAKGISMMMLGHDDVVISFQERQSPPLQGWPAFEGATHIETGYQVVTDIGAWNDFWTKVVGLSAREVRERRADKAIGPNDYRLPHNTKGLDDSKQGGAYPIKGGEQLLGVRQFLNATGADYAARAQPPNLGIIGIRMPFKDIDALAKRVADAMIPFAAPKQVYTIAPYGKVKGFAILQPGGSGLWTEFFEMDPQPMTAAEMKAFLARDRVSAWVPTGWKGGGTSTWRADGSAEVTWSTGKAVGRWTLKGNAICTEWTTLRDGRESCAIYYDMGDGVYQSYTLTGQPEGMNTFR
jgi:hypothetical protein